MDVHKIVELVYAIQGLADPNHPDTSLKERMQEIYDTASEIMQGTGYHPD